MSDAEDESRSAPEPELDGEERSPDSVPADAVQAPDEMHSPGRSSRPRQGDTESLDDFDSHQSARHESSNTLHGPQTINGAAIYGNSSGPMHFTEVHIAAGGRRVRILVGTLSSNDVEKTKRLHVKVGNHGTLESKLRDAHLAVLRDRPRSGRRTTGTVALERHVGSDKVRVIVLDENGSLDDIYEDAHALFRKGRGYLVNLRNQSISTDVLRALSGKLRSLGAFVVIIHAPTGSADDTDREYTFPHPRPHPVDVLNSHLPALLNDHLRSCINLCDEKLMDSYVGQCLHNENFQQQLQFQASPRMMVDFAEALVAGMHAGDEPAEVLVRLPNQLRESVALALQEQDFQPDEPDRGPLRQAILTCCAIFDDRPLADVFESCQILLRQVLPRFETRETVLTQTVFYSKLTNLIEESGSDTKLLVLTNDTPRRVRFVAPSLAALVLDVVWHDFISTRVPLMTLLDLLAGHERAVVQVRAAQVAGFLATFGFDEIYRALIGTWARGNARYRESAALALEVAAGDERLLTRIRDRIEDWSNSPNTRLRDTAARAYGTRIGAMVPHDAIKALYAFAKKSDLADSKAIAAALARLYIAGASEQVLNELCEWIGSEVKYVRRHAVRTLLLLARLSTQRSATDIPRLASMTDSSRLGSLVSLWRGALLHRETGARAWDSLQLWLLNADSDDELATVEPLARRVLTGSLAGRALFYLRLWAARYPEAIVLQRLYKDIKDGGMPPRKELEQ